MSLIELPIIVAQKSTVDGKETVTQVLLDALVSPSLVTVLLTDSENAARTIVYLGATVLVVRLSLEDTKKALGL